MTANTYGRQVVIPMTNKSGGSVAAGDVVVIDTTNDTAFTTTTTGRAEISLGIAQETIANNATGRVLVEGYAALVNVPSSMTRGYYLQTHTVAKQATGNSARQSGSFGQFLTGGSTPTAWLWGTADQTASGGFTPAVAVANRSAGNFTLASSTFADVDAVFSHTITTGAHRVRVGFVGTVGLYNDYDIWTWDIMVDGTSVTGANGVLALRRNAGDGGTVIFQDGSFSYVTDALSAGSHTIKLRYKTTNSAVVYGTAPYSQFSVEELGA